MKIIKENSSLNVKKGSDHKIMEDDCYFRVVVFSTLWDYIYLVLLQL